MLQLMCGLVVSRSELYAVLTWVADVAAHVVTNQAANNVLTACP